MSVHPGDTDSHDEVSESSPEHLKNRIKVRPFAGVPARDYVTDVLAAILLLASLGLPWTSRNSTVLDAAEVPWVLPVTILSLLSLSVFYLARLGALPASWTVHSTRKLRLLAGLLYGLAVLAQLILDGTSFAGFQGVGSAAALGFAGAALAAAPRASELGPEDQDREATNLWWRISLGLMVAIVLLMLTWGVLFSFEFLSNSRLDKHFTLVAFEWLVVSALALTPALMVIKGRSRDWRRVLSVFGATIAAVLYLSGDPVPLIGDGPTEGLFSFETLRSFQGDSVLPSPSGAGLILIPGLAAVLASPAVTRRLKQQHPVTGWLMTANAALRFTAMISAALIAVTILALVDGLELASGIPVIIILAILAIASLKADRAMLKKVADGRRVAFAVVGLSVILGIILFKGGLVPSMIFWLGTQEQITWAMILIMLGLPALILFTLIVPAPIREFFTMNKPSKLISGTTAYEWKGPKPKKAVAPQAQAQEGPVQQEPSQLGQTPAPPVTVQPTGAELKAEPIPTRDGSAPDADVEDRGEAATASAPAAVGGQDGLSRAPVSEAPSGVAEQEAPAHEVTAPLDVRGLRSGFTPEDAADPATPAVTLAEIVEQAPELRPYVAVNPTTYPALLEWLSELGDPAVDEALRSRDQ